MPVRRLASNPNLEHLKHQAKDLLREHASRLPDCAQKLREFHPHFRHASDESIFSATLRIGDAQLTIAREHGFPAWTRLKHHIQNPDRAGNLDLPHHQRLEDPVFRHAVDLIDGGHVEELRAFLREHPKLVHQRVLFEGGNYFRSPTLLEFVAENPVRHGKLPANILDVTAVILDAGPDRASRSETLMLVATGSISRECNVQIPLIRLLAEHGADRQATMRMAAVLSEHASVRALLDLGAKIDLPVAAALGKVKEFSALLQSANAEDRHLALAVAAQFGHLEIVRLLLEHGEDPNRYNPPGGHSHGTPLHQSAGGGHQAVVHLLVDSGARLDLRDVLWHATPADWANHEGHAEIAAYLRQQGSPLKLAPQRPPDAGG